MTGNKYIEFYDVTPGTRKTGIVIIRNKRSGTNIGHIKWYGAWRQYVLFPEPDTVWNLDCLRAVNEKIKALMEERRTAHAE